MISIIIPVYNPKNVIFELLSYISLNYKKLKYEIILIDDGSISKNKWKIFKRFKQFKNTKVLVLKRNFGRATAVITGLKHAKGNYAFIIDDDFLHDPKNIFKMLLLIKKYDVVIGNYIRSGSISSQFFSWLKFKIDQILFPSLKFRFGSCLLIKRKVYKKMASTKHNNPYLPAIINKITSNLTSYNLKKFKNIKVNNNNRFTFKIKMKTFIENLFNYSDFPLKLIFFAGLSLVLFAVLFLIYLILSYYENNIKVPGWYSLSILIVLFGSLNIFFLMVLGKYILANMNQNNYDNDKIDKVF